MRIERQNSWENRDLMTLWHYRLTLNLLAVLSSVGYDEAVLMVFNV